MTARFIVGDTRAVTATLPDGSVDMLMCSPPFLALRSYLPADHPDKALEIGSEATPAEFIDVLLALSAEWRRVLAPHGSIVVELGDTYAGSGGAGGDDTIPGHLGFARYGNERRYTVDHLSPNQRAKFGGWPRAKSLILIPEAYRFGLVYGVNPHTGQPSPAGRWQARNVIRRCSPNPPVGALGKKWRPATSELVVACPDDDRRYWDDVATRTTHKVDPSTYTGNGYTKGFPEGIPGEESMPGNPAGAPLLDWWNLLQQRIDRALQQARSGAEGYTADDLFGGTVDKQGQQKETPGGKLIREAWENGEIDLGDVWPIVAGGYPGAHYATWPPELCEAPIEAMCPRRVCLTCGQPSRRETSEPEYVHSGDPRRRTNPAGQPTTTLHLRDGNHIDGQGNTVNSDSQGDRAATRVTTTTGWTTCGCPDTDGIRLDGYHTGQGWRPGVVFDPFAGTGTTLAVATGHGRDAIGIDLDPRNANLAVERVGPLMLTVEHHTREGAA